MIKTAQGWRVAGSRPGELPFDQVGAPVRVENTVFTGRGESSMFRESGLKSGTDVTYLKVYCVQNLTWVSQCQQIDTR